MDLAIKTGRVFFAVCLAGLAVQQFQYGEFRPVFVPDWPAWLHNSRILAYLFGAFLLVAAVAIAGSKNGRILSLVLAFLFLLLFLSCHVINQLFIIPYSFHLGLWTDPLKELALSGSALIVADTFPRPNTIAQNSFIGLLEKLVPIGRIFFGLMLACFGIDHFLYADTVAGLVPAWIGGNMFWTKFAGVALIGAGLSFISRIQLRLIALLTAIMIFIWFVVLHIPRGVADPGGLKGNEVTSIFEALGFSGIALILYSRLKVKGER